MKISLSKATQEDKNTIQNLGRFYVYEMSRYCGFLPSWDVPLNGLFECIDLSSYCEKPDRHAYLVKVDDELAGFVLINKEGSTPDVDWNIGEFFIVSKFQGKGVGRYAAEQVFNMFPGIWETCQMPENTAAIEFWERVVNRYSQGQFEKELKTLPKPKPHPMVVLKFTSQGSPAETLSPIGNDNVGVSSLAELNTFGSEYFFSQKFMWIDLTHDISENIPTWSGDCGFKHTDIIKYEDCTTECKFLVQRFEMFAGIGTHIDYA